MTLEHTYGYIMYDKAIWETSPRFALSFPCVSMLIAIDVCGEAGNSLYVQRGDIMRLHSSYTEKWNKRVLRRLINAGYLSQTGGTASRSASPNRHCFNKTQYCLTSEGKLVIRYFHKKYAELMKLPIPVSVHAGFPRGLQRDPITKKIIVPEGYVRSARAIKQAEYRENKKKL
jgi:hypothetical protein